MRKSSTKMRLLPFKTIGFNLSVNVVFANKLKFYSKIKTNKIIQMNRNKSNAKNEKAMTNYQKLMNAKAYIRPVHFTPMFEIQPGSSKNC